MAHKLTGRDSPIFRGMYKRIHEYANHFTCNLPLKLVTFVKPVTFLSQIKIRIHRVFMYICKSELL